MTGFLCAVGFFHHYTVVMTFCGKKIWPGPPFLIIPCSSITNEYKGGRKGLMISEQNEICMTYLNKNNNQTTATKKESYSLKSNKKDAI